MGGLVKFVTVDPSFFEISGRVQGGVSSVRHGNDTGHSVRGSINIPLGETFAVRASAFTRHDPGFIDNVLTGKDDVNSGNADGGRVSALWRPTNNVSLKLGALVQDIERQGRSEAFTLPSLSTWQQSFLPGTGSYDKKIRSLSASLTTKLASADIVALSGYSVNKSSSAIDYTLDPSQSGTVAFVYPPNLYPDLNPPGVPFLEHQETKKFTQEVRLTVPVAERVDWLFGAFYADEDSEVRSSEYAANAETGAIADKVFDNVYPSSYKEYALFTDFTFKVTDRFDVQLGGRQSRTEQRYSQALSGPLVLAIGVSSGTLIEPQNKSEESPFTYLLTPRIKISPDLMVYARLASGYRSGGPNQLCVVFVKPCEYGLDKTRNYELGLKGTFLERKLSLDASVYYIDWQDIQLLALTAGGSDYLANLGNARSEGIELAAESRPWSGLTIAAWLAWNNSELTEDPPADVQISAESGDRLPFSGRYSGNLSVVQELPISTAVSAFFGGSISYLGDRKSEFLAKNPLLPTPPRQSFPAYARTDLHAGLRYDTWTATLFVNNVTDKRVPLSGGRGFYLPFSFTYLEPRSMGLSISKSFSSK
jgi:outer membrane receptor protein involved in Fe transport